MSKSLNSPRSCARHRKTALPLHMKAILFSIFFCDSFFDSFFDIFLRLITTAIDIARAKNFISIRARLAFIFLEQFELIWIL